MLIFVTGATVFIGSAIVKELLGKGHQVIGLTRSNTAARSLRGAGVEVHRGDIEDIASLRSGAANADAVMHPAFNHDLSRYADNCEADGRVIDGSDRSWELICRFRASTRRSASGGARRSPACLPT